MKLAMAMTLDGLMRALRWQAHDLAESVEGGYAAGDREVPVWARRADARQQFREADDDDRSRR